MTVIELRKVSFKYEKGDEPVLTDLDLKVEEGTCLAVTGDNGSGKTTLFRIINGLSFPDKGEYLYKGTAITEAYLKDNACSKRFHKEIGYLFQNPDTMLFNSSVYDEVAFGPRQMGLRDEEVEERVRDCLKLFEIEDLGDKVPYHLSGGQKKWVALASVIALNPEVLVLDEPFAGLDSKKEAWLVDFLSELKAAGKTLIIATHKEEIIKDLADGTFMLG
ncbi:MAG: ABC transporter ATP-binding protein [Firmicutes bacterium]|nr:ABC transporter ATP-binding protein [Bacillota bacterium]